MQKIFLEFSSFLRQLSASSTNKVIYIICTGRERESCVCVCVCISLCVWRREDVAELFSQICICNWRWWRSSRQQELPPDCVQQECLTASFVLSPLLHYIYYYIYMYVRVCVCVCEKLRHFYANNVLQEFLLFIVKIRNVRMRLSAKCKWVCKAGGRRKGV